MNTFFPEIRRIFDLADDEMHGYPEESILAVEESLGTRLPTVLRQFYLELGAHRMNLLQNRLVSLHELNEQEDDDLVAFYVENQGVAVWAVKRDDCSQDDPPVYVQVDADDWALETERVSLFLQTMLHHQASLGGYYEYGAMSTAIDEKLTSFIKMNFPASDEHFRVWLGLSIYASSPDYSVELWTAEDSVQVDLSIGAKTKEQFLALYDPLRQFDIRWDARPDWLTD